jgi:hypothetical protein
VRVFGFRSLLLGVAALTALVGAMEIGLRVYDSATAQITRPDLYDTGLTAKSWFSHHTLKPSHTFLVRNPDTDERVRVLVSSSGTRGVDPVIPKPPGVFRIICLGDERTLAPFVEEDSTFCALLRDRLQRRTRLRVEVINAGTPWYCPLLSLLQYRHHLAGLEPDLLLLNFDMSDVADDHRYRRLTTLRRDLPVSCPHPQLSVPKYPGQSKWETAFLLPRVIRSQFGEILTDVVAPDRTIGIENPEGCYLWCRDSPPDWTVYIDQALTPIDGLNRIRNSSMLFGVATYPAPWQVSGEATSGEGVRERFGVNPDELMESRFPFERIAEACELYQVPFLDTSGAFTRHSDPVSLFMTNSDAFTAEGHDLYASQLEVFVASLAPLVFNLTPTSQPDGRGAPDMTSLPGDGFESGDGPVRAAGNWEMDNVPDDGRADVFRRK